MSVVYEAMDERLKRKVAIKVLHPFLMEKKEYCERFFKEALMVAKLQHPNIVQIYDIVDKDNNAENLYIVTEYVSGFTLLDFAHKNPQILEVPEASLIIIWQLALALAHAHDKGIIHRDVKEENVMVTLDGQVKLMDFGIASLKGDEGFTQEGTLLGSLANVAPEVIKGERATQLSEIFSLSSVLYFLLTGQKPFVKSSPEALLKAILFETPTPVQSLSPYVTDEIAEICEVGLSKDPKKRFSSAISMAEKIEEVLSRMGLKADPIMLGKMLKDPQKGLEDGKIEIFNSIEKQINNYVQNKDEIKALALKQRINLIPKHKIYRKHIYKKILLITPFLCLPLFFLPFYQWLNKKEQEPKTTILEQIPVLTLEEAPKGESIDIKEEKNEPEKRNQNTLKIKAIVSITVWPFADIYIDGKKIKEKTKYLRMMLNQGSHQLSFKHPFAQDEEEIIKIEDDKPINVNIILEKTKPAKLVIKSKTEADIAIDNIYKGTTKESLKKPIIISLPNKTSQIKKDILVTKPGFKTWLKSVEFVAGKTVLLDVDLLEH